MVEVRGFRGVSPGNVHSAAIAAALALGLSLSLSACDRSSGHMDFVESGTPPEVNAGTGKCQTDLVQGYAGIAAVPVTYEEDVKPKIFQRVCAECHGRVAGLPNWLDYTQAYAKRDVIRFRVTNKIMPPQNATIKSLTDAEIKLVQDWVDGGAIRTAASAPPTTNPAPGATPSTGGCDPTVGATPGPVAGATPLPAEPPGSSEPPVPLDPPPPPRPTFVAHLKPMIFTPICGSCHGVNPDLPNWQIYAEAEHRKDKIRRKVMEGEMPPPSSGIHLTDNQKALIIKWVDIGAPYE